MFDYDNDIKKSTYELEKLIQTKKQTFVLCWTKEPMNIILLLNLSLK